MNPIIIVKRGTCSFVTKVRNIEHAGGRAAIVVDDKFEDVQYVIMSDDGTGGGIRIPSMLVGKGDGQKLIDWLESLGGTQTKKHVPLPGDFDFDSEIEPDEDDEDSEDVNPRKPKKLSREEKENKRLLEQSYIGIQFNMDKPDNRVEYDIWFTSTDDRALDFINNFKEYDALLGNKVLMTPHYITFDCQQCDDSKRNNDCYGEGKFCALNQSNINLKGQEIINEDLRQACVYNNSMSDNGNAQNFWDYMARAHASCAGYINEDCSKRVHSDLNLDFDETMGCVRKSFDKSNGVGNPQSGNIALESERQYWNNYGANFYPSIVINNRTYRGVFEPEAVFEAICAGFKNLPSQCKRGIDGGSGITLGTVLYIAIGMILFNLCLLFCYRRV